MKHVILQLGIYVKQNTISCYSGIFSWKQKKYCSLKIIRMINMCSIANVQALSILHNFINTYIMAHINNLYNSLSPL